MPRIDEIASELLTGAYDLHVHTAPDVHLPRVQDDIEYAQEAAAAGMRGCVLKNHHTLTTDRAAVVRKLVPGFECFGAVCLNRAVGGTNPFAVEAALGFIGLSEICKIVWMPTISAKGYPRKHPRDPGWGVLDENGSIREEVREVLEVIRSHDCALATGHLPIVDQFALVRAAAEMGLRKVIVTHVDAPLLGIDVAAQKELSRYAYLEHSAIHSLPTNAAIPIAKIASDLRDVGIDRCFLSTDLGQDFNVRPVIGLHAFVSGLLRAGLSATELRTMLVTNPGALVS